MPIEGYRQLEAWQVGMQFVEHCYSATKDFDVSERFGLTSQIRRSAVSIPSNLAEGYCRRTARAYLNHVGIALDSHGELETCLELAVRLRLLPGRTHQALAAECGVPGRLLTRLWQSLDRKINSSQS